MRAVLTNFGTVGDIQPFLALAIEMRDHGHEPVMAFSPNFAERVRRFGLPFISIGPDLRREQDKVNAAMMTMTDSGEQLTGLMSPLVEALPQILNELLEVSRGADVLISGPAQPAGRMVHEMTGIPFVSIQMSHFGGSGAPALRQLGSDFINPFRIKLGLAPLRDPLTIDANSPQLAIYAMSRHVRPPQADWPPHYHLTGFFFLDSDADRIDPSLEEFLANGHPPAVITFGSMTHANPEALADLLVEAVELAGCRAIIQQSWNGASIRNAGPEVYFAGYVPHRRLFSGAAFVVHHGGGGTAGAVFRSGVPSIFVPHGNLFDQHYWARLAEELGCAGPAIPFHDLTTERLGSAIKQLVADPRYLQSARALSGQVAAETGVRKARQLIEQLVRQMGLSSSESNLSNTRPYRLQNVIQGRRAQQQQRLLRQRRPAV